MLGLRGGSEIVTSRYMNNTYSGQVLGRGKEVWPHRETWWKLGCACTWGRWRHRWHGRGSDIAWLEGMCKRDGGRHHVGAGEHPVESRSHFLWQGLWTQLLENTRILGHLVQGHLKLEGWRLAQELHHRAVA